MPEDETRNVKKRNELEWSRVYDNMYKVESSWERTKRKVKENPLVPIGCIATVGALSYGIWSFLHGRTQTSQYMMRARVMAQAFTICALVGGLMLKTRPQS